jgi:predicted nucleic acid-binding protein
MKALLDTCIIMDAIQNRKPFNDDAQTIFRAAANKVFTGYITAKSCTDIYYLTHRCTHNDKEARTILTKLCILFDILDTSGIDIRKAISSNISDYEDAVMIETAIRAELDCIVTRNTKDYANSPIRIYSPSDFIKYLESTTS